MFGHTPVELERIHPNMCFLDKNKKSNQWTMELTNLELINHSSTTTETQLAINGARG